MYYPANHKYIALIEEGLKRKRYNVEEFAVVTLSDIKSGGSALWIAPDNTHGIAIFYNAVQPAIKYCNSTEEIDLVRAEFVQCAATILSALDQVFPDLEPLNPFQFSTNHVPSLLLNHALTNRWSLELPGALKRFFHLHLDNTRRIQVLCAGNIDHIVFLHIDAVDGNIVAGGEQSIELLSLPSSISEKISPVLHYNFFSSFDLTLAPGEYYLECYGYDFEGLFTVFASEYFSEEGERPHMYDDDRFDAFGNERQRVFELVEFNPPSVMLSSDAYGSGVSDESKLYDGIEQYADRLGNRSYIQGFSYIQLNTNEPFCLGKIRIAGNEVLKQQIEGGGCYLEAYDGNSWQHVCQLAGSGSLDVAGYPGWIFEQEIDTELVGSAWVMFFTWNASNVATEIEMFKSV
jgi:hypothetical protein